METLTKDQAIAAMKEGKRVRHEHFSDNEWMEMHGVVFIFEDGVKCDRQMFWADRQSGAWNHGWSIVEKTSPPLSADNNVVQTPFCVSVVEPVQPTPSEKEELRKKFNDFCNKENSCLWEVKKRTNVFDFFYSEIEKRDKQLKDAMDDAKDLAAKLDRVNQQLYELRPDSEKWQRPKIDNL